ncbi:NKX6-1 [Cordylochernes scorpioides]|uniref:NKX6-1 n=1 Tax=Cordylochernes scorpioides TaxID=51811 RepID=A0ABY6L130_9ARAC|nr:NKX6-1 [Cordylochernes scorpioides]
MEPRQSGFLVGAPPLAALHSMAELRPPFSAATPHGINDILSRPLPPPPPATATATSPLPALPRFSLGYFNGGLHKLGLGELSARPHLYWPGVNPALWRDRFASAAAAAGMRIEPTVFRLPGRCYVH